MIFKTIGKLVLASGSPRRSELLGLAGLEPEILPGLAAEPAPEPGEDPTVFAIRAARAKAMEAAARRPGAVVLAADTVAALHGEIMGKPRDEREAEAMLTRLCGGEPEPGGRGRSHWVITGVCLIDGRGPRAMPASSEPGAQAAYDPEGAAVKELTVSSEVVMALQPREVIAAYASCGEPLDKAGAYAIQGRGAFLVRSVRGSYTNVVGLPLAEVLEALGGGGVVVPGQG